MCRKVVGWRRQRNRPHRSAHRQKTGPVGRTAFAMLATQSAGHSSLLAVLTPNLICKPATVMITKVTIKGAKQAVQMFGPAQAAVAKAVADSVAEGVNTPATRPTVFDDRILELDALDASARRAAGLANGEADLVVTNPPFFVSSEVRPSPDAARARAHVLAAGDAPLQAWIVASLALLAPGGRFAMIHRPEALLGDPRGLRQAARRGRDSTRASAQRRRCDQGADLRHQGLEGAAPPLAGYRTARCLRRLSRRFRPRFTAARQCCRRAPLPSPPLAGRGWGSLSEVQMAGFRGCDAAPAPPPTPPREERGGEKLTQGGRVSTVRRVAPELSHARRQILRRSLAIVPGPDFDLAEFLGAPGLRDPATLRHGSRRRHFPSA